MFNNNSFSKPPDRMQALIEFMTILPEEVLFFFITETLPLESSKQLLWERVPIEEYLQVADFQMLLAPLLLPTSLEGSDPPNNLPHDDDCQYRRLWRVSNGDMKPVEGPGFLPPSAELCLAGDGPTAGWIKKAEGTKIIENSSNKNPTFDFLVQMGFLLKFSSDCFCVKL